MWFKKPAVFKFDDIDHEKMVSEMLDIIEYLQEYRSLFSEKNLEFLDKMIDLLKDQQCSDNQACYLVKMRNAVMFNIVKKQEKQTIEEEIVETLSILRTAYHKNKAAFTEQDIFFLRSFTNGKIEYDRTTKLLYEIKNRIL